MIRTCGILLFVMSAAVAASAQTSSDGSIRGFIKDEQGAVLQGVAVSAKHAETGFVQNAVSDATGFFRLLNLPPGPYSVTAELQGFARFVRDNIVVRVGLNLTLDAVMQLGGVEATVQVKAETPMIEAATAVHAMNVTGEFQRSLPLSTRKNFYDFLWMAPGTVNNDNTTSASFYVNGSDFGSHVIQFDGADIAAGVQSSTLYIFMSSDVLQDVQVTTGGIDASAPLGQGAVINVATQSGTNAIKGLGSGLLQRKDWSGNNVPGGTSTAFDLSQVDVSMGGPVRRDRSWLFGSYRHSRFNLGISRTATQLANLVAIVPGFEPFDNPTRGTQTFVKSTTQFGGHQLQGFHQYGRDQRWVVGATDTVFSRKSWIGGHATSARVSSVWNNALTSRIGAAYNNQSNPDTQLINDRPALVIHQNAFVSANRLTGTGAIATLDNYGPGVSQDAPSGKVTITADLTYYKSNLWGSHELQTGVYLNPYRVYGFEIHYANGGYVFEDNVLRDPNNPGGGYVPFHRAVYDRDFNVAAKNRTKDYAVYVQDAWRPHKRLTLNAGVRVDWIKRRDKLFDAVTQDTTAIGPRIGANYQLTADGYNVLRASWNRLHEAVSVGTGTVIGFSNPGLTDTYDLDLNGTFETSLFTPGVTAVTLNRQLDLEGYRQPHANELALGYRRQFPGQVSVDATFVRREFRDRAATIDVNAIFEDNKFLGYRDPAFNEILKITSNTYNWPVYTALEFQVAKQSARLQLLASYTRQFRHMAGTWQPNDPAAIIQPGAFGTDKGIGGPGATTSNSLSGTDQAGALQWKDHVGRAAAAFQAPWGIRMATTYTYQSGTWSGPVVTRLSAPDPAFGPPTLTLSTGRVVSNPLATLIRFAYPTRGEGQFRLKASHVWNIRLGREFAFDRMRIEPAVDLINLPNLDAFFSLNTGANQQYNPNFMTGGQRQPPRSAQFAVRVTY